jgi:hypothetical protein
MIFLWLIVGCVLVSAAYFLPGHSSELWPNINVAGMVVLVYLAALLGAFARRKDLSARRRTVIVTIAAVVIVAGIFTWSQMEDQSQWQRHKLGEIGTTIGRGIYGAYITDSLLTVLDEYYHQQGKARMTLGQVYKKRFPPGNVGNAWSSFEPTGMPNPPKDVFLTEISDTKIVLVARHPWWHGKDAAFATFNGPRGTLQVRATLTEKGLQYDTEN